MINQLRLQTRITTMKLLKSLSLAALLISAMAVGQAQAYDHFELEDDFGAYDNGPRDPFIGLPARYPIFFTPAANANISIATMQYGRPIVLVGPQTAMALGPNIMGFFMQHEYAHHDLRHIIRNDVNSASKEAEADCQAAQALVRYGREDIIPQVVSWFDSQGCNYNPATPLQNVAEDHPCGTQRAQIVRECSQM